MTQIQRLKAIYELLLQKACSKNDIIAALQPKISLRQLDRDLIDLKENFLRNSEKLIELKDGKRLYYSVNSEPETARVVKFKDCIVLDLFSISGNESLFKSFKRQTNLYQSIKKNIFDLYGENHNFVQKNIIHKTNFYHLQENPTFLNNIIKIYQAIYSEKCINVREIKFDATNENPDLQLKNLELKPIKIIFHRGDYFLFSSHNKKSKIFEIAQLTEIQILEKSFTMSKYNHLFEKELETRFGVTSNITDDIYDIELRFSESTGNYVDKMFWHPSQKIIKLSNKNYQLTMKCGINRELVGWIFQWMHNVKIVQPIALIKLHDRVLKNMIATSENNDRLESVNLFEKKKVSIKN